MDDDDGEANVAADLVLDTNVILEIATIADLNREVVNGASLSSPIFEYRRCRAQASLALAWLLELHRRTSISLKNEPMELTLRLAPPNSPDGDHVWFFTWFFKDLVLPHWRMSVVEDAAFADRGLSGNQRDALLVQLAHREGVCVVSNEARPNGRIAIEASRLGVSVLTPAAYVARNGGDVQVLSEQLLEAIGPALIGFLVERNELSPRAVENCKSYYRLLEFTLTGG